MNKNLFFALVSLTGIGLVPLAASAGVYQAICDGGNRCSVMLANGQITLPGATIDKDRILSWSQGGAGSRTDVGMGVATTVLFGLPGILGFGAKKHDYQFSINYIDEKGNFQMSSISFKNSTPANQFMMELMGLTGLSLGSVNTSLQSRIDKIKADEAEKDRIAAEKDRISKLDCGPVLKQYQCSWSKYLEGNPTVKAWAAKFPSMALTEKAKQGAID
jgi:hypothetical protein